MSDSIHCFEKAGLGKAPFRYVGMVAQEIQYGQRVIGHLNGVTFTTKPGGTCDYCGTYIVNMFRIKSSDDKTFVVGCDCVLKTGDAGLIKKIKSSQSLLQSARRKAQKDHKADQDQELCTTTDLSMFADKPHPNAFFASKGKTLKDWADFCLANRSYATLADTIRKHYGWPKTKVVEQVG
jgi:hypothetical protein